MVRNISERVTAAVEKKRLLDQLQWAQKMAAIGMLAGGVAHDLNNVLSGLVSYPELILMDLPEESPLRKPILSPIKGYDDIEEGDFVVLLVTDNGSGISPEDIDRIFEPFCTKKAMGRSGTGLGMAVV